MTEVIEYLESCDIEPTKENIKITLNKWISNLYSHVGEAAHKHSLSCGVIGKTNMSWEEQDMIILEQIERYKRILISLE